MDKNKRGCPVCQGVDPKSCMRCRGKTRLSDWYNQEQKIDAELEPLIGDDATGQRAKAVPIELLERIDNALEELENQYAFNGEDTDHIKIIRDELKK